MSLVCSHCVDETMLEEVLRFDDRFLARAASISDDAVRNRFRRCPTAFHCILDTTNGEPRLRGYFILLPLTTACTAAIRSGVISVGKQIGLSDLAPPDKPAEAAYLSVVCAIGARARAALVTSGIRAVRNLYKNRGTRTLFARAATAAGAHMLTRLTKQRFVPDGTIHEIDLSTYTAITASG